MNLKLLNHVVSVIVFFIGLTQLGALAVSLWFDDGSASSIAISAVLTMLAGGSVFLSTREKVVKELGLREGFGIVGLSWFAASFFGALPFWISGVIPEFTYAFFESASGLTTTGSTILREIEGLPEGILFWRSFLHWLGGMGIIVLSVAILPFLGLGGMQLFKAESPGPTKDKLGPRIQETAKFLWFVYVLISLACFTLLWLAGMSVFDAACHMFGTVATGGFSTYNASVGHFHSPLIEYIIIFFMFICGISFSLHYRAILLGKPLCYFKPTEVKAYATIIALATIFIYWTRIADQLPWEQNLRECLFQVVSIMTTTGYGTADFELWHTGAQITLLFLMVVGGCAGSTGGGLKVVRVILLLKYLKTLLNQQLHPAGVFLAKMDGNRVPNKVLHNILGLFATFILIHMFSSFLLSLTGVDLTTATTAVLACLSNIGPGLGEVGPTDNFANFNSFAIWVLNFDMIMGRLELFSVLMLFLPQTWRR
ncbi:MAG: potassium transporter [Acidobacteria bacterium]|nr:MAG: potassium transporter [Acidobacteriota bacterium]